MRSLCIIYITDSVKDYYLEVDSIYQSFAKVSSDRQSIEIESSINEQNPTIKVIVCSNQNGNIISCEVDIEITVYIEKISISATKSEINEDEEIHINELLSKTIYPTVADTTDFKYVIASGNDIVRIDNNNKLNINKSKLTKDNRTFTISATAKHLFNNTIIETIQISVYINTKTLSINVDETAESKINESSTVNITCHKDINSTGNPKIIIISGAELIDGNYRDNDYLTGLSFTVKKNLTNQSDLIHRIGSVIKIKAEQDGIYSDEKTIKVIVPVETMTLNLPEIVDRNFSISTSQISPIFNGNVNNYVTDINFNITNIENGKIENGTIKINLENKSGSIVSVNYISNGKNFTDYLTVNSFNEEFDIQCVGNTVNGNNKFTINYDKAYSTRGAIDINSSLQIEEGGYTTIVLKYNDIALTKYKSLTATINLTKGSQFTTVTKLSNAEFKFSVAKGTVGDSEICYDVILDEDNHHYELNDLKLYVFKEFNTSLTPSITLTTVETLLNIEKTQNASHFTNLTYETVSNTTYTLDNKGNLKVLTDKLNSTSIKFQADQYFNGTKINNTKISMNCIITFNNVEIFKGISAKIKYNLNTVDTTGKSLTTNFKPSISSVYNSDSDTILIKTGDSSVATVTNTKINNVEYYTFYGWMYNSELVTNSSGTFTKNITNYTSNKKWNYTGSTIITLTASWSKVSSYSSYDYISSSTEFLSISTSGNYVICDEINLSGTQFTPIQSFSGLIDGNNNTIKNLSYTLSGSSDDTCDKYGFIKTLSGTIKNLNFDKLQIDVYKYRDGIENLYVGGICGVLSGGTIDNVTITGNSKISGDHYREVTDGNPVKSQVGGFAGAISSGTIKNCSISSSSVYGKAGCGNNNGDCHANVGGIAGEQNGGKVINCIRNNTTSVNSVVRGNTFWWGKGHLYGRAGGIIGYQGPNGVVESCTSATSNYQAVSDLESDWCRDRIYLDSDTICGKQDGTVNQ